MKIVMMIYNMTIKRKTCSRAIMNFHRLVGLAGGGPHGGWEGGGIYLDEPMLWWRMLGWWV